MTSSIIIGIDAGTSVIKAIAFDHQGHQLAASAKPNTYETAPDGKAVQDLPRTWTDTAQVLQELGSKVPDLAARTTAIAVTGQGDGTWLIDDHGDPVGPGWLWLDSRSADIVEELDAAGVVELAYRQTGCAMICCNQSAQLVWMSRNQSELLAKAATAFHCKDWLYFNLTGERATDSSEGIFTFGNFRTRQYALELLDAFGIAHLRHLLPPVDDVQSLAACRPKVLRSEDAREPICVVNAFGAERFREAAKPGATRGHPQP